ncbi:hypothetical protein ACWCQN_47585 [Streptomyces sp. NPDC001984]
MRNLHMRRALAAQGHVALAGALEAVVPQHKADVAAADGGAHHEGEEVFAGLGRWKGTGEMRRVG